MKGRVILRDTLDGRKAAALMVDGRLEDVVIDPRLGAPPMPGAIFRAVADRPLKGQGGIIVRLPRGRGFLRQANGVAPGDTIVVQVSGTAEPGKAVPVTPRLLFKGRYAIITPQAPGINVSRTIKDTAERDRLVSIAQVAMTGAPADHGLILRSAAAGAVNLAVTDDIAAMLASTVAVTALGDVLGEPECLLAGPDAHELAWRDWAVPAPDATINTPGCFDTHGVLEAVDAMLTPAFPLSDGATAFVEPTRALVAIDVNTGADGSLAAGVKANLALARALPRVLRIKGLGGQIVIDAAPMPKKDRRMVEQALRKAFRDDGADVVFAGWTPLGHFEIQKKRDRHPLTDLWLD